MRVAVTVGQDTNGKWHLLALPDQGYQAQRTAVKALGPQGGRIKIGKQTIQMKIAYCLVNANNRGMRKRFDPGRGVPVPAAED